MTLSLSRLLVFFAASLLVDAAAFGAAQGAGQGAAPYGPLPAGVILVKGAWSSAVGTLSPLPEDGKMSNGRYDNAYFGLGYAVGSDWTQRYEGPPPSDSGYYVLAQIEPQNPALDPSMGHILIAAQDLFFSLAPVRNASELISYYRQHLGAEYRVERDPIKVRIANRDFVRLDYLSGVAGLHWHVLATEMRCHVVQFVFTGSSPKSMERLVESMKTMIQPTVSPPVCLKDFATPDTVLEREEPVFSQLRFNPVAVRIVVDAEGRVKHIHFLSAFPEQAKSISDALLQWRFKPYLLNGQAVEVETGLLFGRTARPSTAALH
jgi:hypothetical protein